MQENFEERIVYSADEVAKILGISRPSVFQGIKRDEIPHIRVGHRILIPKSALLKLLANAGSQAQGVDR